MGMTEQNDTGTGREGADEQKMRTIEVCLSRDGSAFSWLTYFLDGGGLTHAAIALDEDAEYYYSFNFKGFKREYKTSLKKRPRDMVRYKVEVTEEQYQSLKNILEQMESEKGRYQYAKLGVVMRLLRLPGPSPDEEKLFCSQFVASILDEAGVIKTEELPGRITPNDLEFELGKSGKAKEVTVDTQLHSPAEKPLDAAVSGLEKGKDLVVEFTAGQIEKAENADNPLSNLIVRVGTGTIEKAETVYEAGATLARQAKKLSESLPEALAAKTGGLMQKASNAIDRILGKDGEEKAALPVREEKEETGITDCEEQGGKE